MLDSGEEGDEEEEEDSWEEGDEEEEEKLEIAVI